MSTAQPKPKTFKQLAVEQAKADAEYLAIIFRKMLNETGKVDDATRITAAWASSSVGTMRAIEAPLRLPGYTPDVKDHFENFGK